MEECRNISLDSLKQRPTIDELMEYYNVGTKWYLLGVQLKLNTKSLDAINTQYEDVNMKLCKMYELWLSTTPDATKGQLLVALKKSVLMSRQLLLTNVRSLQYQLIAITSSSYRHTATSY